VRDSRACPCLVLAICVGDTFSNTDDVRCALLLFIFFVQELLLKALTDEIRTASSPSAVYPTTEVVNARLLGASSSVLKVSEEEAAQKLQEKMMLPVRKPEKGMALVVVYQYVRRVVSHLGSSLTFVAVAAFVKHIHSLQGIGTWSSPSASSTRRVLKLSADECSELLSGDSFITDAYGRLAMLDSLAKVIDEIDGTASMVSWTGPNKASRVIRCRYGHFANVSFQVSSPRNPYAVLSVALCFFWCGRLVPV